MSMKRSPEPSAGVQAGPNRWDILVFALVAALAAACALVLWRPAAGEGGPLTAVVSVDGGETARLVLAEHDGEDYTVSGGGYTLRLSLSAGEVWVAEADCPTQDCVHTGHISRPGQSIVCLPGRVIVRLEGGGGAEPHGGVDAVIG